MGNETYSFFNKINKYDIVETIKIIDNEMFVHYFNDLNYSTIYFKTSKSKFTISIHNYKDQNPHPKNIYEGILLGLPETHNCIKIMKFLCYYHGGWIMWKEDTDWEKLEKDYSKVIQFIFSDF